MPAKCSTAFIVIRANRLGDSAMVLGSFASGGILNRYGWNVICALAFVPVLVAIATLMLSEHRVWRSSDRNRRFLGDYQLSGNIQLLLSPHSAKRIGPVTKPSQ